MYIFITVINLEIRAVILKNICYRLFVFINKKKLEILI